MIFRILFFVFVFIPVMIVIIPGQALINALRLPFWNLLPRWFCWKTCSLVWMAVRRMKEEVL